MGCEQGGRNPKQEGEEEPVESEKVCFGLVEFISLWRLGRTNSDSAQWQDKRLSIIVSLMLSSQTKDPVTHQVTPGGSVALLTTFPLADAILNFSMDRRR